MKKWFYHLDSKKQTIFVGFSWGLSVLCFILIGISPSESDNLSAFDFFLCFLLIVAVVFSILFTAWKVKSKKETQSQNNSMILNHTETLTNATTNQIVGDTKKIETNVNFSKIENGFYLRWHYKENIAFACNLDKVKLNDSDLEIKPEPDNQYDSNAVALYKGGYKLGYFYKGQTQEMILNYINNSNYQIKIIVCLLDNENNKFAVQIAFYHRLDAVQLTTITVPLIKITKRAEEFESSRYENVSMMDIGDYVEITDNYEGGYIVCDEYGNELGELSDSSSKKIEAYFEDIIYAKIVEIEETESDSYRVKISISYR
ncbi:MAG: HIRAN domain-containing protein [Agathobacter sp.]